jgi:Integrase core domain
MTDRSCRPRHNPNRTPARTERRIIRLRMKRLGPARIAWQLGLNPSTVHRVLTRYGCPKLAHLDRATAAPVRRYERDRPGELVHVDVKKLGNIPDGGGHRTRGRSQGKRNRRTTPGVRRNQHYEAGLGYSYLHTALDDHSRLAYTEILPDERQDTAAAFLHRPRLVRPPRHHHRTRHQRQRILLQIPALGRHLRPAAHHSQAHPALPAPDQRQSRTVPPHPRRRMGLRPALRHRYTAARRLARLAPHLQQSPTTHRTRRPPTRQPRHQPVRPVHLGRAYARGRRRPPAGILAQRTDGAKSLLVEGRR